MDKIVGFFTGFSLRTWLIAGAIIAFGFWTYKVYDAGYDKADAIWKAKALEAKIAKLELELKVQKDADAEEDAADAVIAAENEELQKKVSDYEEKLKTRPDGSCVLTDDDINGMP